MRTARSRSAAPGSRNASVWTGAGVSPSQSPNPVRPVLSMPSLTSTNAATGRDRVCAAASPSARVRSVRSAVGSVGNPPLSGAPSMSNRSTASGGPPRPSASAFVSRSTASRARA